MRKASYPLLAAALVVAMGVQVVRAADHGGAKKPNPDALDGTQVVS
jgi:hypothetical protein